jgi:hypothetical protein
VIGYGLASGYAAGARDLVAHRQVDYREFLRAFDLKATLARHVFADGRAKKLVYAVSSVK